MELGLIGQAAGMFAVANIGQAAGRVRVVLGQYLAFAPILAVSIAGALCAGLLPAALIPYLGVLPLALGIRAAWRLRRTGDDDEPTGVQ